MADSDDTKAKSKGRASRPQPPETVLTSLQLVSVAATLGAIVMLVMSLARYGWALPS